MKKSLLQAIITDTLGWLLRRILSLRYRVRLEGFENLDTRDGWLVLPNHPAEIEPVIMASFVWPYLRVRPVLLEEFYTRGYARWLLASARAIPIPDLEKTRSAEKVRVLKKQLARIINAQKDGDNILLYPSGRLSRDGHERVGNAASVHLILQRHPTARVLLVRVRGLWGSSFSCVEGDMPHLEHALLRGIKALIANALVFCPRRDVVITCEPAPDNFPYEGTRAEVNTWLEKWYNKEGGEPVVRVPLSRRAAREGD